LGLVWRETGAVRNARPSRGQAASTRKEAAVVKRWRSLPLENDGWLLGMEVSTPGGTYQN
jgi:hypothetical protein